LLYYWPVIIIDVDIKYLEIKVYITQVIILDLCGTVDHNFLVQADEH